MSAFDPARYEVSSERDDYTLTLDCMIRPHVISSASIAVATEYPGQCTLAELLALAQAHHERYHAAS